jgi:hypothetical protein
MRLTLTCKLSAETRGELIDTFGASAKEFKLAMEQVVAQQGFAGLPPEKVELRWIFETGRWTEASTCSL